MNFKQNYYITENKNCQETTNFGQDFIDIF